MSDTSQSSPIVSASGPDNPLLKAVADAFPDRAVRRDRA